MSELNEAVDVAQPQEVVADNESDNLENNSSEVEEEVSVDESGTQADDSPDGEDDAKREEFPKKARNALSRKNKEAAKLRKKIWELENRLATKNEPQEAQEIDPDQFETYGEYLEQKMQSEVEKKFQQKDADMQREQLTSQQEQLQGQRNQYIAEQSKDIQAQLPDYVQVVQSNVQTIAQLPDAIADIFYNIDNAPLAAYVLAKEGKLESLAYASPHVAAYEIMSAQSKGSGLLNSSAPSQPKPVQVSQAPQPMKAVKGTGTLKKPIHQRDGSDILKWVKA